MKKNLPRLERAFTEMPPKLPMEIERTFKRGEIEMKRRHKLYVTLTAVAACAVLMAGLAFATGQMTKPKPDRVVTEQGGHGAPEADEDILPEITPEPTPMPEVTPIPTATPEVTPESTPTPEVTPEPTPTPELAGELEIVYTQPESNYYHSVQDCSGMVGAIEWTKASAISVGKQPCPVCMSVEIDDAVETPELEPEAIEAPMYYTEAGVYFHGDAHCSGMVGAEPHTIELALASGKQRCPVCQPVEPDHYDLFLKAFGQGLDALAPGYVYSYSSGKIDFFDETPWCEWNVTDGKETLPVCGVTDFLKANSSDPTAYSVLDTPLEDVMRFSFEVERLGNLWPFLSKTEAGGIALAEKDEAMERTIEMAGIEGPLNMEERNVWVAIGSDGAIKELEVYYVDAAGGCSATIGWKLTDGKYVFSGVVEPHDNTADLGSVSTEG